MSCRTPHDATVRPDSFLIPEQVMKTCRHLNRAGAESYIVGGAVRDLTLGITPKDFDIEVYAVPEKVLLRCLNELGHTEQVGRQFGVIKLWIEGMEIDVALPRTELKTDEGHRGFIVSFDPDLSPESASLRRDFTINAMMFDPVNSIFLDFHHGASHLRSGILQHISPAFAEDPLRVLRGMQFAARFKLDMDQETAKLCQSLLHEAETLPDSRIWIEWQKWAHATYPSYGLKVLKQSGWIKLYPELETMIGCPQDAKWHPEGDVWVHTLQVVDQAARVAVDRNLDRSERQYLMFAALCHDFGKPATTVTSKQGDIRSPNHSEAGFEPTRSFLKRIAAPKAIARQVHPLVHDHVTHLSGQPTPRAVRRLADRLEPASIELWEMLVEADASGRSPEDASHELSPVRPAEAWLKKAVELEYHRQKPAPVITGKMFIELGISPGPALGKMLTIAYQAQLDGEFTDVDSAKSWLSKTVNKQ